MANDNWRTPPEVFNKLNQEFNFRADMASSDENKLCKINYTEKDDSLSFSWCEKHLKEFFHGSRDFVWCNPPYSNPLPWVRKAIGSQYGGLGVVMLLNADDSTKWFNEALPCVSEIRRITGYYDDGGKWQNGRIAFLNDDDQPVKGNSKAQFILVFNPHKIGEAQTTYIQKRYFYE